MRSWLQGGSFCTLFQYLYLRCKYPFMILLQFIDWMFHVQRASQYKLIIGNVELSLVSCLQRCPGSSHPATSPAQLRRMWTRPARCPVDGNPLELSTNLREVPQCPEKAPTRDFSQGWAMWLIQIIIIKAACQLCFSRQASQFHVYFSAYCI